MANLANLLATIAANVYTNHNNEVTAQMVKDALGAIVSTMGQGGYIYKGLATTSTNPSSPDANVFYIATAAGTYTNFGGIVVNAGEVAILKGTGTSWSKDVTGAATAAKLTELGHDVDELADLPLPVDVEEDGFYVTDKNLNILFSVNKGIIDAFGIGENLASFIKGMLCFIDAAEDGFYLTDENKNVLLSLKKGVLDSLKLGDNLLDYLQRTLGAGKYKAVTNSIYDELYKLREETSRAVNSLISLKESGGNNFSGTITIPMSQVSDNIKHGVFRIGLHYGSRLGTPAWHDVFFGGNVKKDFSDVRVKDANGNILPARFLHAGNYEVVNDSRLPPGYLGIDAAGKMYITGSGGKIRVSSDELRTTTELPNQTISCRLVFFDSKGGIWTNAGAKIYVCYPVGGAYDFANNIEVVDMSVSNGVTNTNVNLAGYKGELAEDSAGYVYIGQYQENYNAVVFRTINPISASGLTPDGSGNYVFECYNQPRVYKPDGVTLDYDYVDQHIHHISIYTAKDANNEDVDNIIVGIDNSNGQYGPNIISSIDHGQTWVSFREWTDSEEWRKQNGHDYMFSWMAPDLSYTLCLGEVNVLGGQTIWKVWTEVDAEGRIRPTSLAYPLNTGKGCRFPCDYGDDFVFVNEQYTYNTSGMELLLSDDKAKSWRSIYHKYLRFGTDLAPVVGGGFRDFFGGGVVLNAESNTPCYYGVGGAYGVRVYPKNGHYYGELLVEVGDLAAGEDVELTIESGYAMAYPSSDILRRDEVSPVWVLPLNEGTGDIVMDSNGIRHKISGDYEWDAPDNTMCYGTFYPRQRAGGETGGLKLHKGASISIGKVPQLKFHNGFSFVVWIADGVYPLTDDFQSKNIIGDDDYDKYSPIVGVPGCEIGITRVTFYAGIKGNAFRGSLREMGVPHEMLYRPYMITISGDALPTVTGYIGDDVAAAFNVESASSWIVDDLSTLELKIGTSEDSANYTNRNLYFKNIMFFDKVLTADEFRSIANGFGIIEGWNQLN